MVSYFCHQVLLVIELLAREDLREHLLTLRPEYVHSPLVALHTYPIRPARACYVHDLRKKTPLALRNWLFQILREGEGVDSGLPHTLLSYCRQIISGLSYLAKKGFVHRDIAARNILLSEDHETCKVWTHTHTRTHAHMLTHTAYVSYLSMVGGGGMATIEGRW